MEDTGTFCGMPRRRRVHLLRPRLQHAGAQRVRPARLDLQRSPSPTASRPCRRPRLLVRPRTWPPMARRRAALGLAVEHAPRVRGGRALQPGRRRRRPLRSSPRAASEGRLHRRPALVHPAISGSTEPLVGGVLDWTINWNADSVGAPTRLGRPASNPHCDHPRPNPPAGRPRPDERQLHLHRPAAAHGRPRTRSRASGLLGRPRQGDHHRVDHEHHRHGAGAGVQRPPDDGEEVLPFCGHGGFDASHASRHDGRTTIPSGPAT